MSDTCQGPPPAVGSSSGWNELAERVLEGHRLTLEEGLSVLRSADHDLLDLLAAAYKVRYRWFGNRVHLNFLTNAKSGLCSEDCGYCSQSRVSRADIEKYEMLEPDALLDGARMAARLDTKTYCIVISGKSPHDGELDRICELVPQMKAQWDLKICASVGLLTSEQAARLKAAGVDRVNHNLNTSERFYPAICSTHSYRERLETLDRLRAAGLEICSGGIVGMGEEDADVVELALTLGRFEVEAVPVNFLLPIPGTLLGDVSQASGATAETALSRLNPRYCLKVLALFRLANPRCELRIAAGREVHLGPLQPLGLYPASSIFVGDYLTTRGQPPEDDYRMIEAMGFEAAPGRPAMRQ